MKEDVWEGVEAAMCKTIPIQSPNEFSMELNKAIKQKNKLVLDLKDMYTTFMTLEIIQKSSENEKENVISKLNVV